MQKLSKPEIRAEDIFTRLGLNLKRNDGSTNPLKIYLREHRKGTSILRDGKLYSDYPENATQKRSPKNYKLIIPDYTFKNSFIEIKDNISGKSWDELSIHSLNDNLRIALLRMRINDIPNISIPYHKINLYEKKIVDRRLKDHKRSLPSDRYYLRWDELKNIIPSPDDNFKRTTLKIGTHDLKIKVVSGTEISGFPSLFILDNEILDNWIMSNRLRIIN